LKLLREENKTCLSSRGGSSDIVLSEMHVFSYYFSYSSLTHPLKYSINLNKQTNTEFIIYKKGTM